MHNGVIEEINGYKIMPGATKDSFYVLPPGVNSFYCNQERDEQNFMGFYSSIEDAKTEIKERLDQYDEFALDIISLLKDEGFLHNFNDSPAEGLMQAAKSYFEQHDGKVFERYGIAGIKSRIDSIFYDMPKDFPLYVPEHADKEDEPYTKERFVELCEGNTSNALLLFQMCEWQHPETILDEDSYCLDPCFV